MGRQGLAAHHQQPVIRRLPALLAAAGLAAAAHAASPAGDLAAALSGYVAQPAFARATWGIAVAAPGSNSPLWETNAARFFTPASVTKLFTGALALDVFGPDHRLETRVLAADFPDRRGRLRGDLVIVGAGDFSFAARFHGGRHELSLDRLADAIAAAGVREVEGGLVGDDTALRGPRLGPGWAWDDLQYYYGAEPSALAAEDNVLDLVLRPGAAVGEPCVIEPQPPRPPFELRNETRTGPTNAPPRITIERPLRGGPVTLRGVLPLGGRTWTGAVAVHEPAAWFLTLLRAELEERGIRLRGPERVAAAPAAGLVELARVPSPPMRELVRLMMKPSQNLYAHTLLLLAGERTAPDTADAGDAGLRALAQFARRQGLDPAGIRLEEGAGLSRGTLVTPAAVLALLQVMDGHPAAADFVAALPVAGVDGTLRGRFREGPARGNLHAKTGTLTGVHSLAGHVTNAAGARLTFVILLNHYLPPGADAPSGRDAVDAVANLLAGSRVAAP